MHKLNGEGLVFEKDETTATGDDERGIAGPRFGELLTCNQALQ